MNNSTTLADRVIKNSYYQTLLQFLTFLFPVILTPVIMSKIGQEQFGIYALVLGFITAFGLFDLSISSSFVVFLSRYHEQRDEKNLNSYFNTGLFFYIAFTVVICLAGYLAKDIVIDFLNIPERFRETAVTVYYIGLAVFLVSSVFAIFSSVLISRQEMFLTSIAGIVGGILNFVLSLGALYSGYGLVGLMTAQLITVVVVSLINYFYARKAVPELRISLGSVTSSAVREMSRFGSQMQVSKFAGFLSEKYDEFLLAHFTTLSNVAYFNIASRVSRTARLLPYQIIPQVAPLASSLTARSEFLKITRLFEKATKYLLLASCPLFVFIFAFSDLLIETWMGSGFELSADLLKVLAIGQLANLTLSAPGNSIIPNTGMPKIQMQEGLLNLGINLVLSFLLIKHYGIFGAALGSAISMLIASAFVFARSTGHFKEELLSMIRRFYLPPSAAAINAGVVSFTLYYVSVKFIYPFDGGRFSGLIYLALTSVLFSALYILMIRKFGYIDGNDKIMISKTVSKILPSQKFLPAGKILPENERAYKGEKVSLFIVTHNRLGMLRRCVESLMPTLGNIDYELFVIDNASDDGTADYLKTVSERYPRAKVITNTSNIGTNAKSQGAEMTTGDYIIGIDDDVIGFPPGWVQSMVTGYKTIPRMGYLATDVVQDETTNGAKDTPENYRADEYDGVVLQVGPTGGWCFMVSREVYGHVGKLLTFKDRIFFSEDGDYVNRIIMKGYRYGILEGVKVYHATGDYHNKEFRKVFDEKFADYRKGNPPGYELKMKFRRMFSPKRYFMKIEEFSKKSMRWD